MTVLTTSLARDVLSHVAPRLISGRSHRARRRWLVSSDRRIAGVKSVFLGVAALSALAVAWQALRRRAGSSALSDRLDRELEGSFPASDAPTVTQPGISPS